MFGFLLVCESRVRAKSMHQVQWPRLAARGIVLLRDVRRGSRGHPWAARHGCHASVRRGRRVAMAEGGPAAGTVAAESEDDESEDDESEDYEPEDDESEDDESEGDESEDDESEDDESEGDASDLARGGRGRGPRGACCPEASKSRLAPSRPTAHALRVWPRATLAVATLAATTLAATTPAGLCRVSRSWVGLFCLCTLSVSHSGRTLCAALFLIVFHSVCRFHGRFRAA